jgi:hypothetical protein
MSFTQACGSILLLFIQNYKDAKNEKAQKGVVETATNAILNHIGIYWKSKGWISHKI